MNKEDYVSFEVAKLLKDKGYEDYTQSIYDEYGIFHNNMTSVKNPLKSTEEYYSAPTLFESQKWLREKYKLHITIYSSSQESWMYRVTKPHKSLKEGLYGEDFDTYEGALNEGIKEALKII